MVALHPDNVPDVKTAINNTGAMSPWADLTPIEFPIVFRENGDWVQYVDEYRDDGSPADPGVCIIDQDGNFYAAYQFVTLVHPHIDNVVRRVDELLGARQPVDTVLAIDRSGSMGNPPPSGGVPDPKIEIVKDAVGVFLDVWEANAVPGDRVSVVDFSGDVQQYTDPISLETLVSVPDDLAAIEAYVLSLTDGGITCMGGAVATGLDTVEGSGRRHIILFSDGMQNCNPVLVEDGAFIQILHVDPGDVGLHDFVNSIVGDSAVPPKPGTDLEDFDTHIHTIGVGLSGSPWTDLMSEIARETDGLHFETPAPEIDLQDFYITDLLESFTGATPQLVQHSHGTYHNDQNPIDDPCWINTTAHWLTVVLSWQGDPDRNRLCLNLEAPDGTLIEIDGRIKRGPRRSVVSMPLPPYHRGRLVQHAGLWRLHITGTTDGTVPYQVFWIVDDRHVHLDIKKITRQYYIEETLPLEVNMLMDGRPIPLAFIQESVVHVSTPTIDLDDFIRAYEVKPDVLERLRKEVSYLRSASDLELKVHALSQDPKAVTHLAKQRVQTLTLEPQKTGLVRQVKLTRPGMHRFDFKIFALDHRGVPVVRSRTLQTWVRSRRRRPIEVKS